MKKPAKISGAQFYQLCELLKADAASETPINRPGVTQVNLAAWATEKMAVEISTSTIATALDTTGLRQTPKRSMQCELVNGDTTMFHAVCLLSTAVKELYAYAEKPLPPILQDLHTELHRELAA